MFHVYNKITGKRLYAGKSFNFANSFIEVLNRRGLPHILVCK